MHFQSRAAMYDDRFGDQLFTSVGQLMGTWVLMGVWVSADSWVFGRRPTQVICKCLIISLI